MKELEKIIEELREKNINILDLEIANEIKWQTDYSDKEFTEDEKQKLWDNVERAYSKSSDLTIENITRAALNNFDELDNMDTWDLIEEACWI